MGDISTTILGGALARLQQPSRASLVAITSAPRFVKFTSPFWFGMYGYFDDQDSTVVDFTDDGRQVLMQAGIAPDDVAYAGVVHTDSVLPVAHFDESTSTVAVRIPSPWDEVHDGLPFVPQVIVTVGAQHDPPRVEGVSFARARELFPGNSNRSRRTSSTPGPPRTSSNGELT